jgi:hypothetical protein
MVSGFIQGSYWNMAADFIEVELMGYYMLKINRIFGFIEFYKFTIKR